MRKLRGNSSLRRMSASRKKPSELRPSSLGGFTFASGDSSGGAATVTNTSTTTLTTTTTTTTTTTSTTITTTTATTTQGGPLTVWSSGGDTNTAAKNQPAAGGDETGCFKAGGKIPPATAYSTPMETYNGTAWTAEANDLANARSSTWGGGDDTDGITSTGYDGGTMDETEEWNGTTWSAGTACTVSVRLGAGGGSGSNSAIQISGYNNAACNEYNGTSWSAAGSLNTIEYRHGGTGDVGDAIKFGGDPDNPLEDPKIGETWNGTTWTTISDTSISRVRCSSSGNSTDAGAWGGSKVGDEHIADCEDWNGTSWSSSADNLNSARNDMGNGQCGSGASNGISINGEIIAGTFTNTVEELTTT